MAVESVPTVVVAGASAGLGAQSAIAAARLGYAVVLLARSQQRLHDVAKQCREAAVTHARAAAVLPFAVDLAAPSEVRAVFSSLAADAGLAPRALINTAATWGGRRRVRELTGADILDAVTNNVLTSLHPTQEFIRWWEALPADMESFISIVNVGATASRRGGAETAAFSISKAALRSMTQSLAKEEWSSRVHVMHVIVDGLLDNSRTVELNPDRPARRYISCGALAEQIMQRVQEPLGSWTFEWDSTNTWNEW